MIMNIKVIDFGFQHSLRRAHYDDAGADVYLTESVSIHPNDTVVIPLGFGLEIPEGYVGFFFPKTGIVKKYKLAPYSCPIDSGYRGELSVLIHNTSGKAQYIHAGTCLVQLVLIPVALPNFISNNRGDGAFGSTGVKANDVL